MGLFLCVKKKGFPHNHSCFFTIFQIVFYNLVGVSKRLELLNKEGNEMGADENMVICVDCGAMLKEKFALVVQQEPTSYTCIDCYVETLDKQYLNRKKTGDSLLP